MTDQVNNVQSFALGGMSKIDRNRVDLSFRKKIKKEGLDFKSDNKLNDTEIKLLKKEFGMSKEQVEEWAKLSNGVEFLEAMLHAGENYTDKNVIKAEREKVAKNFLLQNRTTHLGEDEEFLRKQLSEFGIDADEISQAVEDNYINKEAPVRTITPDVLSGDTNVQKVRIHISTDANGNKSMERIDLYSANTDGDLALNADPNDKNFKGTLLLDKETGLYVLRDSQNADNIRYFKLQGELGEHGLKEVTFSRKASSHVENLNKSQNESVHNDVKQKAETYLKDNIDKIDQASMDKLRSVLVEKKIEATKKAISTTSTVTIDAGKSRQRLVKARRWNTGFLVPRNAKYTKSGLPTQVAIRLPDDYGIKGEDGKRKVGYQNWNLIDEKKGIYQDRAGIRKYQVQINGNRITFKQVDIDDKKIKDFLDVETELAAELAKQKALNNEQNKLEIRNQGDAKAIIQNMAADRNKAWETYLQAGSDNGYTTGSQGLFEKMVDTSDKTGIKTYNDIKPAIDGLLARVPQDPTILNSKEYEKVQSIIDIMKQDPNKELTTGWFRGNFQGNPTRELDKALTNLAKVHLAGRIQGANHANNSFLVGGSGKVLIQPEASSSAFMSDAKFTVGGKDYFLYQKRPWYVPDRTMDFQDTVEHKDDGDLDELSVIRNYVTSNDRHGEISFDAKRAEGQEFYFKNDSGEKLPIVVDGHVVYVVGADGTTKVPIDDVLNGRANMPN